MVDGLRENSGFESRSEALRLEFAGKSLEELAAYGQKFVGLRDYLDDEGNLREEFRRNLDKKERYTWALMAAMEQTRDPEAIAFLGALSVNNILRSDSRDQEGFGYRSRKTKPLFSWTAFAVAAYAQRKPSHEQGLLDDYLLGIDFEELERYLPDYDWPKIVVASYVMKQVDAGLRPESDKRKAAEFLAKNFGFKKVLAGGVSLDWWDSSYGECLDAETLNAMLMYENDYMEDGWEPIQDAFAREILKLGDELYPDQVGVFANKPRLVQKLQSLEFWSRYVEESLRDVRNERLAQLQESRQAEERMRQLEVERAREQDAKVSGILEVWERGLESLEVDPDRIKQPLINLEVPSSRHIKPIFVPEGMAVAGMIDAGWHNSDEIFTFLDELAHMTRNFELLRRIDALLQFSELGGRVQGVFRALLSDPEGLVAGWDSLLEGAGLEELQIKIGYAKWFLTSIGYMTSDVIAKWVINDIPRWQRISNEREESVHRNAAWNDIIDGGLQAYGSLVEEYAEVGELSAEQLEELITGKGEYLKCLVARGTGLEQISDTAVREEFSASDTPGSVMIGMSMSVGLRLVMTHTLSTSLSPLDGISLKHGSTVEEKRKYLEVQDFVAAHEIGHVVDRELGVDGGDYSKDFVKETYAESLVSIADRLAGGYGDKNKLVERMEHEVAECFIDGLGWRMSTEFGTGNLNDATVEQREATVANGFLQALKVVSERIQREDVDDDDEEENAAKLKLFGGMLFCVRARVGMEKFVGVEGEVRAECERVIGELEEFLDQKMEDEMKLNDGEKALLKECGVGARDEALRVAYDQASQSV